MARLLAYRTVRTRTGFTMHKVLVHAHSIVQISNSVSHVARDASLDSASAHFSVLKFSISSRDRATVSRDTCG